MDFKNIINSVIDEPSYDRIMAYIDLARRSSEVEIIAGGKGDKSIGYFIEPIVIVVSNPHFITMGEEIFGGARASGTNDKAGSHLNLTRWVSPGTIKETLIPATDFMCPFMDKIEK